MKQLFSKTYTHATADSTNPKYVTGSPEPGGQYVMVWVRNTTNQNLLVRLEHALTDPADNSTQRWGAISTTTGVAEATFAPASSGDGQMVIFDGGCLPQGIRVRLAAVAAITGTATVSVSAWVGP